MRHNFVGCVLVLLLVGVGQAIKKNAADRVRLNDGSVGEISLNNVRTTPRDPYYVQEMSIGSNSVTTLNVTYVPPNISFLIFQVHIYQFNITLSYDKDHLNKASNRSVFGSNIGLYVKPNSTQLQMFLKNDNPQKVLAMIVITLYGHNAPIPGGCNMEFDTEIAPYEKVLVHDGMVIVDAQPASMPLNGVVNPNCDKTPVLHEMYQMYLPEYDFTSDTYFLSIGRMLTVDDIVQNGRKVANPNVFSLMRRVFSAYTGTGSVYVTVATYGSYSAAYVPTFSYACSPVTDPTSCEILPDGTSKFISAVTFIIGVCSIFAGHYIQPADNFIPLLFTCTVIGYCAIGSIGYSLLAGFIVALVAMWFSTVCPCIVTFTLGLFVACIVQLNAPGWIILQNNWVFWILFITTSVCVGLITALLGSIACIVTCAVFSSFMVILPIDYWTGSSLKYIIINVIRRATVSGFGSALVTPPIQTTDIVLIVFWMLMIIIRFTSPLIPGVLQSAGYGVTENTRLLSSVF